MEEKGMQEDPRYAQLRAMANRAKSGGSGGPGSRPPSSGPNMGGAPPNMSPHGELNHIS